MVDASVKSHLREYFPYKLPLSEEQLLQRNNDRKIFGYVQRDIEIPENPIRYFSIFPAISKNTAVSKEDFGPLMTEYAEK